MILELAGVLTGSCAAARAALKSKIDQQRGKRLSGIFTTLSSGK